jgi:putative membrane protein
MGVGGWVGMGVFWLAVVALVVWGVSRLFPTRQGPSSPGSSPQDVLDARLASGEIDPTTYRALREELEAARQGAVSGPA